ncbi:MAG: hypothetical protein VB119_06835 [Candidatus Metalachnospira sp.]|nr:hypothetical protein [Candidatus Metalachnospira sp.]
MFNYEDGIKDSIPDDGVVFTDLAPQNKNGRMLKATGYPDRAGSIDGKLRSLQLMVNLQQMALYMMYEALVLIMS